MSADTKLCPTCGAALEKITYPGGVFNREQWESMRAGDWWCESCPDNGRGRSGAYYWDSEVAAPPAVAPAGEPTASVIPPIISTARDELSRLCAGRGGRTSAGLVGRHWTMSVPVRPDDSDEIFSDLIVFAAETEAELARTRAALHEIAGFAEPWASGTGPMDTVWAVKCMAALIESQTAALNAEASK